MTRHELKDQVQHDRFTDTVSGIVQYTTSHRDRVIRIGAAVVALLIVIGAIVWYNSYRRSIRRQDLEAAFVVLSAPVGAPNPSGKTFPTEDAKYTASVKALSEVIAKDGDSDEGMLARYYLGTLKAQRDPKSAEPDLRAAADSGSDVAPLAKIALASVYSGENRMADARNLLQSIVDKPSSLVSKQQAQLMLAQLEASSNPKEANKILQSLKSAKESPAVSRAAEQLSSTEAR